MKQSYDNGSYDNEPYDPWKITDYMEAIDKIGREHVVLFRADGQVVYTITSGWILVYVKIAPSFISIMHLFPIHGEVKTMQKIK